MIVCGNIVMRDGKLQACGNEMTCIKTGMDVMIHDSYAYRGDLFECRKCNTRVANTNSSGTNISKSETKEAKESEYTIWYDQ